MKIEKTKICKDCAPVYTENIDRCPDCGSLLLSREEFEKERDGRNLCREDYGSGIEL